MNAMTYSDQLLETQLKADLWKKFGSLESPAEWDGRNYGGGKLSQRWWEYFKMIEFLDLTPDSIVLDIGGGSPKTGAGFFARLIHPYVKKVIIADPCISPDARDEENLVLIRDYLGPAQLREILETNINITHIACISVLEHMQDDLRRSLVQVINNSFNGQNLAATFEYHAANCFFDYQLTARSVSHMFSPLTNFFPSKIESAPMYCENAYKKGTLTPQWYPIAVKFQAII
jgi:hypothetical protein